MLVADFGTQPHRKDAENYEHSLSSAVFGRRLEGRREKHLKFAGKKSVIVELDNNIVSVLFVVAHQIAAEHVAQLAADVVVIVRLQEPPAPASHDGGSSRYTLGGFEEMGLKVRCPVGWVVVVTYLPKRLSMLLTRSRSASSVREFFFFSGGEQNRPCALSALFTSDEERYLCTPDSISDKRRSGLEAGVEHFLGDT